MLGENCEIDIDQCTSNPCMNGGTCRQLLGSGYSCLCEMGWYGEHCELGLFYL